MDSVRNLAAIWMLLFITAIVSETLVEEDVGELSLFDIGLAEFEDIEELSNHIDRGLDNFVNPNVKPDTDVDESDPDTSVEEGFGSFSSEEDGTASEESDEEVEIDGWMPRIRKPHHAHRPGHRRQNGQRRQGHHFSKGNPFVTHGSRRRGPPRRVETQDETPEFKEARGSWGHGMGHGWGHGRGHRRGGGHGGYHGQGMMGYGAGFGPGKRGPCPNGQPCPLAGAPPPNRFRAFMDPSSFAGRWDEAAMDEKLEFFCERIRYGRHIQYLRSIDPLELTPGMAKRLEFHNKMDMCCTSEGEQRRTCFDSIKRQRIDDMCTDYLEDSDTFDGVQSGPNCLYNLRESCCPLVADDRYQCFNQSWTAMYGRWQQLGQGQGSGPGNRRWDSSPGVVTSGFKKARRYGDRFEEKDEQSTEENIDEEKEDDTMNGEMANKRVPFKRRQNKNRGGIKQKGSIKQKTKRKQGLKVECCRNGKDVGSELKNMRWSVCRKESRVYVRLNSVINGRLACKVSFKKCCIKASLVSNPPSVGGEAIAPLEDFDPETEADAEDSGISLETLLLIEEEDEMEANEEVLPVDASDILD